MLELVMFGLSRSLKLGMCAIAVKALLLHRCTCSMLERLVEMRQPL